MIDPRPDRLPALPLTVSPPRPFVERRHSYRRTEDRIAYEEKALLARALDILASDVAPEERLAGLLRLLARTVGARRAAVLADGVERRVAVAVDVDEDPADAEALAAWLDANAPRSRAHRAATGRAPISFVVGAAAEVRPRDPAPAVVEPPAERIVVSPLDAPRYASLPIPTAGDVVLGFELRRGVDAEQVAVRLPPILARHAAVALALVTQQLAAERELASLRAGESERTTFVSTVAHELRTPLTGLRGYLELILAGKVADPAVEREFLERGRAIVGSMGELVSDLLDLSRLESGTLGLDVEPISMAEAVQHTATGLLPIAIERGIHLTTAVPPRLHVALGDRRRVEQVLTNLGANALKFTSRGGSVEIMARIDSQTAIFAIRDDGPGIPIDDQARIFERFHRMAGHERITGTGLGLPIARDLARRMDGDLDVASVPGAGSSFVLVLPGAAGATAELVSGAMAVALAAEEEALEERAVRRAIAERNAASDGDAGHGPGTERRAATARLRSLPPPLDSANSA